VLNAARARSWLRCSQVRGALATQRRDYEAAREQVRSGTLARYLEQLAEVNRLRASVGMAPLPPDPAAAALQQ